MQVTCWNDASLSCTSTHDETQRLNIILHHPILSSDCKFHVPERVREDISITIITWIPDRAVQVLVTETNESKWVREGCIQERLNVSTKREVFADH